jgi:4-alpha-glucanotransferase
MTKNNKNILSDRRRSGILAHISSLPSPYGIGDIGNASYDFLDFLVDSGQSCWQFLPLNPTNTLFDNSPYMSTSAFAGSPLLISPEILADDGLIDRSSLSLHPDFSVYTTDYRAAGIFKKMLLKEAFTNFHTQPAPQYKDFLQSHAWLDDYALFMALKDHFKDIPWFLWPKGIARREQKAMAQQHEILAESIDYYKFEQFVFYSQWLSLRKKATERKILLFGDIPIYVGLDSVDVWAHQNIYTLDPTSNMPTIVSGVPPDYFSETGQRWGNPLYRWDSDSPEVLQHLEDWWVERLTVVFELVDIARIDHFRAFESYWAIPADNETAIDGEWLPGPGIDFFNRIEKRLGHLDIVAEDLGIITDKVLELRDALGFPGMKVLQFAFDGNPDNYFLPQNFETSNCVVYTGTHDNDTTVGWFFSNQINEEQRHTVKRMANRRLHDETGIHQDMIYLALSSTSNLSIFPLQDILGFGNDCRMNSPGVPQGNWGWRCAPQFLHHDVRNYMRAQTALFGRTEKE